MRKVGLSLLILFLLVILFRGPLYRALTHYEVVSYREVPTLPDAGLRAVSDSLSRLSADDEEVFVFQVQEYVADRLVFRARNSGRTAAAIRAGGQANCVGYARLLTDLLNRSAVIRASGLYARSAVAKIFILGFDVHQFTDSPFFRDHDVVEIRNADGGVYRVLDPSLFDYTGVSWVE